MSAWMIQQAQTGDETKKPKGESLSDSPLYFDENLLGQSVKNRQKAASQGEEGWL